MKKLLLIIALLISALGLNAQYATIGGLEFTVTSETPAECAVSRYSGEPTDVTIPSTVTISGKEYSVTSIGERAFFTRYLLTSIEIPSSVTSIGSYAFSGCSSLTSIEIPSGVTYIEDEAFSNCSSLTSIEIPSGVTSIGDAAFFYCDNLTSIEFGENSQLTSIGESAFYVCSSLTSIEIPSSVTSIGDYAFSDCSSLTSIEIPSGVIFIGSSAFSGCSSLTSIEIPSGVIFIGSSTFSGCSSLTIIEIPSSVISIGSYAFYGCSSLTSIEIPSSVTSIGSYTFSNCSSLTSIEIPSGVTSIYSSAFYGCSSLTSIDFGENSKLTYIGESAFEICTSLTSIEIPSSVTSIGILAFSGCSSLTSIDFGENSQLSSIGAAAFSFCSSLTSIEIPSGVTEISGDLCGGTFSGCSSLTSVTFGENSKLTSIGYYAFERCTSLASIEIPSSVTSIVDYAFRSCSSLTSIEIPSSVTYIGDCAFSGCSSLTSIIVESGNTVYDSRDNCNAIIKTATNILIAGCQNTVIPNTVTSIGAGAFWFCSSLTSIEIPSGVTYIGNYAFYGCSSLTSISCHAESVPETGSNAFDDCPSDMVIYVPEQSVDAYKAASPWNNYTIMPLSYIVAAAANPEEAGVITGTGEYTLNDTVTLTATANEGYKFVNWTENDTVVSTEAEYSFEITKDRNLVANFELLTYEIVASVNIENAGEITGAGSYEENDTVTLTAKANEGYRFVSWAENDTVVSTEAEYSFVITRDRNLVANFELLTYEVVASVNIENAGEITGAGSYEENDTVTLTAKANEGYKFVNWTEDGEVISSVAEYSFVIIKDRNLVANFEKLEDPEEPADTTTLAAPTNLRAAIRQDIPGYNYKFEITMMWDAVDGAKGYDIYVNTADTIGFYMGYTNGTAYVAGTNNEGTLEFYVVAFNDSIESAPSETYTITIVDDAIEELEASFNIYPNPVNDKLYIETLTQTQTLTVEIYDVYGRRQSMVNGQQSMVNGQQSTVIDVTDLNSGVYFVKVVTSEGEAVKRFIKK